MSGPRWHLWTDCLNRVHRWYGISRAHAITALPPCGNYVPGALAAALLTVPAPAPRPVAPWPSFSAPGYLAPLGGVGGYGEAFPTGYVVGGGVILGNSGGYITDHGTSSGYAAPVSAGFSPDTLSGSTLAEGGALVVAETVPVAPVPEPSSLCLLYTSPSPRDS